MRVRSSAPSARRRWILGGALTLVAVGSVLAWTSFRRGPSIVVERASLGPLDREANGASSQPVLSADGRLVAFGSLADNLDADDTNRLADVFVRDRTTRRTERVSLATDGGQSDGHSSNPAISADGRFVAFQSEATTLVANDTNGVSDVFVRDLAQRLTSRVSRGSRDEQGDDASSNPSISGDGRFVAFQSRATTLVEGDTNASSDIFVHDRQSGRTERVSIATDGSQSDGDSGAPSISADGRFVAFYSWATNLVPGASSRIAQVYVHDRQTRRTERVSVGPDASQSNGLSSQPSISSDGRFVAFVSHAGNLVAQPANLHGGVFVYDRVTGVTESACVGLGGQPANDYSASPAISADGRYVAFQSRASNLVENDTNGSGDVFLYDRRSRRTLRVSVSADGRQSNGYVLRVAISANGAIVAFGGAADTLVTNDTNAVADIFVVQWALPDGILAPSGPSARGGVW